MKKYTPEEIFSSAVVSCMRSGYSSSDGSLFESVHAALCAKEIASLLNNKALILEFTERQEFDNHDEGKHIIAKWAKLKKLDFEFELNVSIAVVDVLIYADDVGIFEIGTTRTTKMILLLKYISRQDRPYTVHFWPYGTNKGIVFKNWY